MIRLGICNELFEDWEFGQVCRTVKALGYDGLEIAPFTLAPLITEITLGRLRELQRRGSEPKAAKPTMLRVNQVTHLRPHQRPGALRVITQHHLVPDPHLSQAVDLDQRESAYIARLVRNVARSLERRAQTSRTLALAAARIANGWQHEMAGTLELPQCLHAASGLRTQARIEKPKVLTHRLRERRPIRMYVVVQ